MPDHVVRSRHHRARWLLPMVFFVGYFAMDHSIPDLPSSFLFLTLINAAALVILLSRLTPDLQQRTLWIWLVLALVIDGYFLQTYWFALHLNDPLYINRNYSELRFVTAQRLVDVYPWITLGFASFCLSASAVTMLTRATFRARENQPRRIRPGQTRHLVVFLLLVYLLGALLRASLGLGVLGTNGGSLPFRLGSALNFFQQSIVPALLVLAVWVFDRQSRRLANATVLLLVAVALIDAFTTTSRGSLLLLTAPVAFLWILTRRMSVHRSVAIGAIALSVVALFPILSTIRGVKLGYQTSVEGPPLSVDAVAQSTFFVVSRLGSGGADGVWHAYDHRGRPSVGKVLSFLRPYVMTRYYSNSVVHVVLPNDLRTPGLVGALMIMGGATLVVVGIFLLVLLTHSLWSGLIRLECWPVALAISAPPVALFVMAGAFDFLSLVKVLLSAALCEVVYKKMLTRPGHSASSPTQVPELAATAAT